MKPARGIEGHGASGGLRIGGSNWTAARAESGGGISTGIESQREKRAAELPRHLAEAGWGGVRMAAHLAELEDHRQGVGQYPDHGEHHKGRVLMNRGLLQMLTMGAGRFSLIDRTAKKIGSGVLTTVTAERRW